MKKNQRFSVASMGVLFFVNFSILGQSLSDFTYNGNQGPPLQNAVTTDVQFNGYTNHWQNTYNHWIRYGNLFKMAPPDVEKTIMQSKIDIAEDMGIPGLIMQEGFLNGLLQEAFTTLEQPDPELLQRSLSQGNVLVFLDPGSSAGKMVTSLVPDNDRWQSALNSYQYGADNLQMADAFVLEKGDKRVFVVSSSQEILRGALKQLIENTLQILENYNLHKGWFGAESLLKSVTCTKGHPLEVISAGLNEGSSWFVFNGYMDFLAKDELDKWMKDVGLAVVTDVGFAPVFGCRDYDGLQVQSMYTKESWIDYAKKKDGYVFRQVWDTLADPLHYDGYFATEGNKEQIENENLPFVLRTGRLDQHARQSMVLFIKKGQTLTRESMWDAILDRREVGVLEQGKMLGPALYRNTLQLLLLDRVFMEDYFKDRIEISAVVEGYDLQVTIKNSSAEALSGSLEITLPPGMKVKEKQKSSLALPSGSSATRHFTLSPQKGAMDHTNPIAASFNWEGKNKRTLAILDLPPAISVHRLLYGHTPQVSFPVTIHNFTEKSSFPVELQVIDTKNAGKVIFKTKQTCQTGTGTFKDLQFKLDVNPGEYEVKVSALGTEYISQLGVGNAEGTPYAFEIDLNSDGVNEYRLENDSVQVTLLATGARVIEYIVKSRNDNVLFKLWPDKAIDHKRSFRKRGYYPYGGFEDFLGQASMETHQVYEAEMVKKEGDYVRVRMWTDYFGNKLEKTFTLYGDSPLLEVRYAITFKNPEANVLGPQPILELGQKHWTEDVFTIPEQDGLHEYRMMPEKYYGRLFFPKEGWNAGYDTKQDIAFVGAFPVDQPLFLHMWMNHPRNGDAHHYYVEFQPWVPIFQKSTMYFTYYLWAAGGPWENGVKSLREKNLISTVNQ